MLSYSLSPGAPTHFAGTGPEPTWPSPEVREPDFHSGNERGGLQQSDQQEAQQSSEGARPSGFSVVLGRLTSSLLPFFCPAMLLRRSRVSIGRPQGAPLLAVLLSPHFPRFCVSKPCFNCRIFRRDLFTTHNRPALGSKSMSPLDKYVRREFNRRFM